MRLIVVSLKRSELQTRGKVVLVPFEAIADVELQRARQHTAAVFRQFDKRAILMLNRVTRNPFPLAPVFLQARLTNPRPLCDPEIRGH